MNTTPESESRSTDPKKNRTSQIEGQRDIIVVRGASGHARFAGNPCRDCYASLLVAVSLDCRPIDATCRTTR